jgi:hypothetical protein
MAGHAAPHSPPAAMATVRPPLRGMASTDRLEAGRRRHRAHRRAEPRCGSGGACGDRCAHRAARGRWRLPRRPRYRRRGATPPGRFENLAPALATGAVASGERGRFVEEEQLGIAPRRHHLPAAVLEAQPATDPTAVPPARRAEPPAGVMQDAAVAHQRAAGRIGDDVARRRDAIVQGHRRSPGRYLRARPQSSPDI